VEMHCRVLGQWITSMSSVGGDPYQVLFTLLCPSRRGDCGAMGIRDKPISAGSLWRELFCRKADWLHPPREFGYQFLQKKRMYCVSCALVGGLHHQYVRT
jgi:hypothetical protein